MEIKPTLVLDETDMKPFFDQFAGVMKMPEGAVFKPRTIAPVASLDLQGNNNWTIEIRGDFIKPEIANK